MPFTPPSLDKLHEATANLIKDFNKLVGRYVPPSYDELRIAVSEMKATYEKRVTEKPKPMIGSVQPNPRHVEEIECIQKLQQMNITDKTTAQHVLLGALVYRYHALAERYKPTFFGLSVYSLVDVWGLLRCSVEKTASYKTITSILGLDNDANRLDVLSIATFGEAYLQSLRLLPSYAGYVPEGEGNFFVQLEAMVEEAKRLSKPLAMQMNCLVSIQALDTSLLNTAKVVCPSFDVFCKALATALKSKETLSRKEMIDCLQKISKMPPIVLGMIDYLIPDDKILTRENHAAFLDELNSRFATYCQFALLGMYVMILKKPEIASDGAKLQMLLHGALGMTPVDEIDEDSALNALSALAHYLEELPGVQSQDSDFNIWGDKLDLLRAIKDEIKTTSMVTPFI